ncbi:MAG: HAD-IIB family hydrolase, partial [Chloroflexi bacterium]|nr:HAD-IIB family hydrolase [Chloroflexota bacterium]
YLQGLVIYNADGAISHQWKLDLSVARQVITFAEDRGFMVVGFAEDRILARTHDQRLIDGFSNYHEISPEIVGPLQNILREIPVNKLIAMGDPKAIKALRWQLDLQIGGRARTMQAGVPWMVEILPPGTSKGVALKQLLKDMKVNPENILAVGDAENDIEMLQLAGIGVAMGQAAQNVKDAADWVTTTCDEDGVAVALERYVLTEPEAAKVESIPAAAPAVVIEPTTAVTPAQDAEAKEQAKS